MGTYQSTSKWVRALALFCAIQISGISAFGQGDQVLINGKVQDGTDTSPKENYNGEISDERYEQDFKKYCADVINLTDREAGAEDGTSLRAEYCQASKDSKAAEELTGTLRITWLGVAVTCAASCTASLASLGFASTLETACIGANLMAAGNEIVQIMWLNKDYANALNDTEKGVVYGGTVLSALSAGGIGVASGLAGSGAAAGAAGAAAPAAGEAGKEGAKEAAGVMSCVTAAIAGGMAASKFITHDRAKTAKIENLEKASGVWSPVRAVASGPGAAEIDGASSGDNKSRSDAGGAASTTGKTEEEGLFAAENNCFKQATTALGSLNCARASDKYLPSSITTPEFADAFKQLSGQDFNSFLDNVPRSASAADIMGAGFAGIGDPNQMAAAFAPFDALKPLGGLEDSSSRPMYGMGSPASGSRRPSRSSSLGGMSSLSKLFGKKDKKKKDDPYMMDFTTMMDSRSPASIPQDTKIDLFMRVSYRYNKSKDRVENLPWADPYNKSVTNRR